MSYKVSIESPDWGEIELKILTREEIAKLDFEEKRIYLNYSFVKETNDDEYTLGVYDLFREVLNDNDPGDLGFPEITRDFIQKRHPDIFEKFSNIEDLEERQKSYADFISSDIDIEEAFDVYFVDEMYSCDFFYDSLIERCKL